MKTIATATLLTAALLTTNLFATGSDEGSVPQAKRTSLGLYITAADAYEMWKADPANVKVIDVRTPQEFRTVGYPKMAAKIPLSASEQFVGQVRRIASPDDTILVICRSGNRSAAAVEMLARAGYDKAYTVVDGFEGDRNSDGRRTVNGWKNAGLPWTR